MESFYNFIDKSQDLFLVLYPLAALASSWLFYRVRLWSLLILSIGIWLSGLGLFGIFFPAWEDYSLQSESQSSGARVEMISHGIRWSNTTMLLGSLGIVGGYLRLIAACWLAYDVATGNFGKAVDDAYQGFRPSAPE